LLSNLRVFIGVLDECRVSLVESYVSREKEENLNVPQTYSEFHSEVMHDLGLCYVTASRVQDCPSLVNLHPRPTHRAEPPPTNPAVGDTPSVTTPAPGKRRRSTDGSESDAGRSDYLPKMARRAWKRQLTDPTGS